MAVFFVNTEEVPLSVEKSLRPLQALHDYFLPGTISDFHSCVIGVGCVGFMSVWPFAS